MNETTQLSPVEIIIEQAQQAVSEGKMTSETFEELKAKLHEKQTLSPPKVAIIGKAGVGKSTTINNLFSVVDFVIDTINIDVADGENGENYVSDIDTGSVRPIRKRFNLKSGACLDIIDMPGLGDDIEKDETHERFYQQILPQCDIVLYIMEAPDRSYSEDQRILRNVVLPSCKDIKQKLVVAINKVDKIGEKDGYLWDIRINLPTRDQEVLIENKLSDVQKRFSGEFGISKDKIVCYSGLKRYHLKDLLLALTHINPFIDAMGDADPIALMPETYRKKWEVAKKILND